MNKTTEKAFACLTGALTHLTLQMPFFFMAAITFKLLTDVKYKSVQWSTYYHCIILISLGLLVFIRLCLIDFSLKKILENLNKDKNECKHES